MDVEEHELQEFNLLTFLAVFELFNPNRGRGRRLQLPQKMDLDVGFHLVNSLGLVKCWNGLRLKLGLQAILRR